MTDPAEIARRDAEEAWKARNPGAYGIAETPRMRGFIDGFIKGRLSTADRLVEAEKALREIAEGDFPTVNIAWHLRDVARAFLARRQETRRSRTVVAALPSRPANPPKEPMKMNSSSRSSGADCIALETQPLEALWERVHEAFRLAAIAGADHVTFELRDAESLLVMAENSL